MACIASFSILLFDQEFHAQRSTRPREHGTGANAQLDQDASQCPCALLHLVMSWPCSQRKSPQCKRECCTMPRVTTSYARTHESAPTIRAPRRCDCVAGQAQRRTACRYLPMRKHTGIFI